MISGVTVVMPTFNRAEYLAESLDSLLAQSVLPDQIIVVDDGSTDATCQVLAPYRTRIEYLARANGGKPAAINFALPQVRGRYLWVFDDDDVACPDALARHLAALHEHPEAGWSYGGFYDWPQQSRADTRDHARARPPPSFSENEQFVENLFRSYLPSPAVVVRMDVQRAAGHYREDLVRGEDFEMSVRWGLVAPGVRVADAARPTYYQRQHGGARGPQAGRYPASRLRERSREDARTALRGLAAQIALQHYLPRDCWSQTSSEPLRVRAMLRRWAVHMQKGLWTEALAYAEALAAEPLVANQLADEAASCARRVFLDRYMLRELALEPAVMRAAGALLAQDNLRVLRAVACRHLYYRIRETLAAGRRRDWQPAVRVAHGVFGWLGFAHTLFDDRRRRRRDAAPQPS